MYWFTEQYLLNMLKPNLQDGNPRVLMVIRLVLNVLINVSVSGKVENKWNEIPSERSSHNHDYYRKISILK